MHIFQGIGEDPRSSNSGGASVSSSEKNNKNNNKNNNLREDPRSTGLRGQQDNSQELLRAQESEFRPVRNA